MSEHGNDPVDATTPVFTQWEVFAIGGYLCELWREGAPEEPVDDIEEAIRIILSAP